MGGCNANERDVLHRSSHSIYHMHKQELGNEARFPTVITTVQCSICSQLNNKPRVVVTDFRQQHTCSIRLHSLSGGY